MAKPTKHQLRVHQNRLLGESSLKSYKLTAPNLFDYLQLVEFVNDHRSYFYSVSPDKQTLTIYVYVYSYRVTELIALLPVGVVMERDNYV